MGSAAIKTLSLSSLGLLAASITHAAAPVWTFTPLTPTTVSVDPGATVNVMYQITNQSQKSHTLAMRPIPGITQVTTAGYCSSPFVLGAGQSCTLNLSVNGSTIGGNVFGGPVVCQQGNINQCYRPSEDNLLRVTLINTQLSASVSNLVLSAAGFTEYGLTGNPASGVTRIITITNVGSNAANGLTVNQPTWPTGTTSATTCRGTLAPGDSCTISIKPGNTATSDGTNPCSNGTAPIPQVVSAYAPNTNTVSTQVTILSYGCIYQSGYVFALDDTPPNTASIGGKVAATTDQAPAYPNGILWASNGQGTAGVDGSYDLIPGIDETSTASIGSPTYSAFQTFFANTYTNPNPFVETDFAMCDGTADGACNSANILTYYNELNTNNGEVGGGSPPFTASPGPTNVNFYAAGLCSQTIAGYSDWYLPAICEMIYGQFCSSQSTPSLQNMQSSLVDFNNLNLLSGYYHSSTEDSSNATNLNYHVNFTPTNPSFGGDSKWVAYGARCTRAITN